MPIPTVRLRNRHDRRVREGHPWVFANEIDGDVPSLPAGGTVDVVDHRGEPIGRGYANPRSLITVRLLSRSAEDIDSVGFYVDRLRRAVGRRTAALPGRASLRVCHGEADDLPGLVIDRYADTLVVQITTLGMETRKDLLRHAVIEALGPAAAVLRSEGPSRRLEGLEDQREAWIGEPAEAVDIEENGVRFRVPVQQGQKTGHFYDQALNRQFAGERCAGRTVLDVYANGGAWGLYALSHGATAVVAVDQSEACCAQIGVNAALNGVAERVEVRRADGRQALQALVTEGRRFGAVVLDPPAFAKARKAAGAALRGYREINGLGATLVEPGGWLFTSSCSWHVEEERFVEAVVGGARDAGRRLRLIRRGEQAPDHPMLPEVPETRYLKSLAFLVEPAR